MKYYYIKGRKLVVKSEDWLNNYIYKDGEWVKDIEHYVSDRLIGYDPSEPAGSPYAIGNTDIMDEIESITEEEAMKLIAEYDNKQ